MTCVVLPVKGREQIETTYEALRDLQRSGQRLIPEAEDWLDWAELILRNDSVQLELRMA